MKKHFMFVALLAMFLFVFAGCGNKSNDNQDTSGEITVIVVNYEQEEIFNGKISFDTNDTLLSLLQEHEEISLKGEDGTFGFYILEVAGIHAEKDVPGNAYWSLEVNDEYSMEGISDIKLSDKDVIKLSLIGY